MHLIDAVIMGRFCGLKTVEEAILNVELHYWGCIAPSDLTEAQETFYKEVKEYEEGNLILDETFIQSEVDKQLKEFDEYYTESLTKLHKIH